MMLKKLEFKFSTIPDQTQYKTINSNLLATITLLIGARAQENLHTREKNIITFTTMSAVITTEIEN